MEYVKTDRVKGFSIEGYFADKMEKSDKDVEASSEIEADQLLSLIKKVLIDE